MLEKKPKTKTELVKEINDAQITSFDLMELEEKRDVDEFTKKLTTLLNAKKPLAVIVLVGR